MWNVIPFFLSAYLYPYHLCTRLSFPTDLQRPHPPTTTSCAHLSHGLFLSVCASISGVHTCNSSISGMSALLCFSVSVSLHNLLVEWVHRLANFQNYLDSSICISELVILLHWFLYILIFFWVYLFYMCGYFPCMYVYLVPKEIRRGKSDLLGLEFRQL